MYLLHTFFFSPFFSLALLWYTQKQNKPKQTLEHDPDLPPVVIWLATIFVSIGALILGSELHNIYLDWQGQKSGLIASGTDEVSKLYQEIKQSTTLSIGLILYFAVIRPWTDILFFYRIFHSNLGKLRLYKIRIIITSIITITRHIIIIIFVFVIAIIFIIVTSIAPLLSSSSW